MMPYYFIPFELEAMNNETNKKYPTNGAVYQWKEFKELPLKRKLALASVYKKQYKGYGFKWYVRNIIYPIIKED